MVPKNEKIFSWPNIKAKKLIVPERIGFITPEQIAKEAEYLIKNQEQLQNMRDKLVKQRGKTGAVQRLSQIIISSIKKLN